MSDGVFTSRTDVVTYVAETATELARLAVAARCDRLAYLLEVAAVEAKNAAIPLAEDGDSCVDAGSRRAH